MSGEKNTKKFWVPDGNWTDDLPYARSFVGWLNYRIAQSHYVKWTHNINCITQSCKYFMSNE